jgi:hypothetical protein
MSDELSLLLYMLGIALGFPLLAGLFGWSVLGRFTDLDREERFAACWGVGFAVLAARQFLSFVLLRPEPVQTGGGESWVTTFFYYGRESLFGLTTLLLMLLVAALCWRRRGTEPEPAAPGFRLLLAGCALAYLHLVCIQSLLPDYRGGTWYYDWWMHYDEALVFVGERDIHTTWANNAYTLASRTPLFNLAGASVLAVAGHDFWVFQLAAALLGCCFVPVVYVLLSDLFGPRAAPLALLLAPLDLWMMHEAWFTWSKMLAGYFVLLGLHFYLRFLGLCPEEPRRAGWYFLYFWISCLLGFLTHQSVAVYMAALVLHAALLALFRPAFRPRLRELGVLALTLVLTLEPWYAWLLGNLGPEPVLHGTPTTARTAGTQFTVGHIAEYVESNLWDSVAPLELYYCLTEGPWTFKEAYRALTSLYFSLFTGALTLSLSVFLAFALVRWLLGLGVSIWGYLRAGQQSAPAADAPVPRGAGRRAWVAVVFFLLLGTLGAAVLHPETIIHGIAHAACFPAAILLAALGWGVLSRARPRWAVPVCAGMAAEFLVMFWSHWWLLGNSPEILEPLPGNADYKADSHGTQFLFFLNERLGDWQYVFLAGAVVIQLLLCVLLVRFVCGNRQRRAKDKLARQGVVRE